MATSKEVRELTKAAGVYVDTRLPSDAVTRYLFARVSGGYSTWSGSDTIAVCFGERAALQFLHGVVAGRRLEREQKSKT